MSLGLLCVIPVLADSRSTVFANLENYDVSQYVDLASADVTDIQKAHDLCDKLIDKFNSSDKPTANQEYYCLMHILRWGEKAADTSGVQTVEKQRWIVYSNRRGFWKRLSEGWTDEYLQTRDRLFGTRKIYIYYIHINKHDDMGDTTAFTAARERQRCCRFTMR